MAIYPATKTLALIESVIASDQGASYRGYLGQVIPHVGDAYRTDEFPFRTHLGASGIGQECARKIWFGFRWATLSKHSGRLMRLFNRGHLEEARFIAMMLAAGIEIYQQDAEGNQYKISDAGGHFGGSGDGVGIGIPDIDPTTPALLEFKTSSEKMFLPLIKKGVRECKFEHYVQMQVYMRKMGLAVALYLVVNKNNDELYGEIVPFDAEIADEYIKRGVALVWKDELPTRISETPGWFECRWCDHKPVCHLGKAPHANCRTCSNSKPLEDGTWACTLTGEVLSKQAQFDGCDSYERKF